MTFDAGKLKLHAARLTAVLAAWTLAGAILATQAWFGRDAHGQPIAWTQSLTIWLTWGCLWAMLTPLALALLDRFPLTRGRTMANVALHIAAAFAFALLDLALFATVAPIIGAESAGPTWAATFQRLLATSFLLHVPVYWLIIGAGAALRVARDANERERRALRLEAQLAEARLLVLRAQLEPHFLFNALNTISVLMRENVDDANRVLVLLSGLLRRALDTSTAGEIELRHEIAFAEAYLALEQIRFADRLTYRFDVEPQLLDLHVPSLILQPLIENAVRHGLRERKADGSIEIAAERQDDMLWLTVRDNGQGIVADASEGVGLSNTRSRLALLYGERHSFDLLPGPGGGLLVRIGIPLPANEEVS